MSQGTPGPNGPSRPMGLAGVVASSWRLYTANFGRLLPLFAAIAAVFSIAPVVVIAVTGDRAGLGLGLVFSIALPAVGASLGFATIAFILEGGGEGGPTLKDAVVKTAARIRVLIGPAVAAAGLAVLILFTFGVYGLFMYPLFFGPPVLMQVATVEDLPFSEAWERTRSLLAGNWLRVVTYLLTITLGISVLRIAVGNLVAGPSDITTQRAIALSLLQILVDGLFYPFLGTVSFVAYRDLEQLGGRETD